MADKDRDSSPYRSFVEDFHPFPGRGRVNFGAVDREERLVGGNDMLAVFYGLQDEAFGRLVAADELDD